MTEVDVVQRFREYFQQEHGLPVPDSKKKKDNMYTRMKKFEQEVLELLTVHRVPYTEREDEDTYEDYLLSDDEDAAKPKLKKLKKLNKASADEGKGDDVDERIASIKNKLRQKKGPATERQQKKREAKKLKRSKGVQKLLSSAKIIKNEHIKQNKVKAGFVKTEQTAYEDGSDSKADIKPLKSQPLYNEEAKIVYSKIDFAANPGSKAKKSHQNPKEILKKLKDTRQHIKDLKEQGETSKAAELQTDIAWKKAFDKIEGKKVKDDTKLLQKAIKKRKVEKRVAKKKWTERKDKVEYDKSKKQKKRQDNLEKRSKDKKNRKMKKASKKGRIIPGF